MYSQPPGWLIALAIVAFALPASALIGLAAAWLFERFSRRGPSSYSGAPVLT
jgi:ABC-type sulfate transport system permease subunit